MNDSFDSRKLEPVVRLEAALPTTGGPQERPQPNHLASPEQIADAEATAPDVVVDVNEHVHDQKFDAPAHDPEFNLSLQGPERTDITCTFLVEPGCLPMRVVIRQSNDLVFDGVAEQLEHLDIVAEDAAFASNSESSAIRTVLNEALIKGTMRRLASGGSAQDHLFGKQDAAGPARLDEAIANWLEGVEPDWGPASRGEHEDRLIALLESMSCYLKPAGLENIRDAVNTRYREFGYLPLTKGKFQARVAAARRLQPERQRLRLQAEADRQAAEDGLPSPAPRSRYAALSQMSDFGAGTPAVGLVDLEADSAKLANFELVLEGHVDVADESEPSTQFKGRLKTPTGVDYAIQIPSSMYATDKEFAAFLYRTGGFKLEINCSLSTLRNAIAQTSPKPRRTRTTTGFGWTEDGTAFLVPGGRITSGGYVADDENTELRLDLSGSPLASRLGLSTLEPPELLRLKQHVVNDLLPLHHRRVTHSMLALTGVAILQRFSGVPHRFAGWLKGETGAGKTLPARLFACFFGNFAPTDDGSSANWSWTANSIESTGYFFRDSLFVVDDFKSGLVQRSQVVRLFQTYADGGGRGRLRRDATFNSLRWIRGQMLVTGENALDDEASSTARTIIVPVEPLATKDLDRRNRCLEESRHYSALTADFVKWLIQNGRLQEFANKVKAEELRIYQTIAGQANDGRVAANFAVFSAAYAEIVEYLGDVIPNWREEVARFRYVDLPALLKPMLDEVQRQRPIETFWNTLVQLVRCNRVRLDDSEEGLADVIGKLDPYLSDVVNVSSELALAEVQKCLREQGRSALPLRPADLANLLDKEGRIAKRTVVTIEDKDKVKLTKQVRIQGALKRCFPVRSSEFFLSEDEERNSEPDHDRIVSGPVVAKLVQAMSRMNAASLGSPERNGSKERNAEIDAGSESPAGAVTRSPT